MSFPVLISWNTVFEQAGWTVGHCSHCGQLTAVRVDNAVEVVRIYLYPVHRRAMGQVARCDFCERPIRLQRSVPTIGLSEWSPPEGLTALFDTLPPFNEIRPPDRPTTKRLRSLLSAAREAASFYKVNIGDISISLAVGAVLGGVLAALIGMSLFDAKLVHDPIDRFVTLCVVIGLAVGASSAGIIAAVFQRVRTAFDKINTACANYEIDVGRLDELSADYGKVIQQAIQRVRDTTDLGA